MGKELLASWLPTSEMPANILTKQLPQPAFEKHHAFLGVTLLLV
jgi:hypothetical protein